MSEQAATEIIRDNKSNITLEISRPDGKQEYHIFIQAPKLAEIIAKMSPGNYALEEYTDIYKTILKPLEKEGKTVKDRVITYPAIARITKNFVAGTDFSWNEQPRSCLLYNPEKLREGFTLVYKITEPVLPDNLRKWGDMFVKGCKDIISNARPFKMSWILSGTEAKPEK